MKPALCALGLAVLTLTWGLPTGAQPVADHLKCYKVMDPQTKTTYTADLGGLVAEPGCNIKVPAVMACVPATKTITGPSMPPGGGGSGTPNSFFCYKVKCPTTTLPTLNGTDQFGSRTVMPSAAKLLCAPLAGPPTTTTTTSTTTTTLRFVDNGDGTVTDHQTGLIWEQKVAGSGCLHCVDDTYTWSSSGTAPDGTAFTSFLNTLNGGATGVGNCVDNGTFPATGTTGGFNGDCDWRLPTIVELKTIVAVGCASHPCIDPVFGPTAGDFYWSSTTSSGAPNSAWVVYFGNGSVNFDGKTFPGHFVRAVRGGS